jgi:hypothetical protein
MVMLKILPFQRFKTADLGPSSLAHLSTSVPAVQGFRPAAFVGRGRLLRRRPSHRAAFQRRFQLQAMPAQPKKVHSSTQVKAFQEIHQYRYAPLR